jgi:hypothetical protein
LRNIAITVAVVAAADTTNARFVLHDKREVSETIDERNCVKCIVSFRFV